MLLDTKQPVLTIKALKEAIKDLPDDTLIRYQKTYEGDIKSSSPIHRIHHNKSGICYMVTEYVDNQSRLI